MKGKGKIDKGDRKMGALWSESVQYILCTYVALSKNKFNNDDDGNTFQN